MCGIIRQGTVKLLRGGPPAATATAGPSHAITDFINRFSAVRAF